MEFGFGVGRELFLDLRKVAGAVPEKDFPALRARGMHHSPPQFISKSFFTTHHFLSCSLRIAIAIGLGFAWLPERLVEERRLILRL